jgi:serine/threonine-protein kinase 24/25/MST4
MADEGLAEQYQVLEELGRASPSCPPPRLLWPLLTVIIGGSFGVVYKAIEKATGETVAIKHVSPLPMARGQF